MNDSTDPPGQARLFDVPAVQDARLRVVDACGRPLAYTASLAVAALAAAAAATRTGRGWIEAPDRWAIQLVPTRDGWEVYGAADAPIDATRRVLQHINQQGTNQ